MLHLSRDIAGACTWLLLAGTGCSALIDQELSNKTSSAESSGGSSPSGGGGAGGASAGGGGALGTSAPSTTSTSHSTTTSSSSATTTTTTECPGGCSLPHASAYCWMGVCEIAHCHPGFADCDGAPESGCEVDLLHDEESCGECGKGCEGDKNCQQGKCK